MFQAKANLFKTICPGPNSDQRDMKLPCLRKSGRMFDRAVIAATDRFCESLQPSDFPVRLIPIQALNHNNATLWHKKKIIFSLFIL